MSENKPIAKGVAELFRIDTLTLKNKQFEELWSTRKTFEAIKIGFANNPGFSDVIKNGAEIKKLLIDKEMSEKLEKKSSYQIRGLLLGSFQVGVAIGLISLIVYDSKKMLNEIFANRTNNIEILKASACTLGLGFSSWKLALSGCWDIKKAIGRELYCKNQMSIAKENMLLAVKLDQFRNRLDNPKQSELENIDSSSSEYGSSGVYPSNQDRTKDT
ncbi:MAG TPA: hypothetical protein VHO47_04250 [Candidatus Babeliales bacterium]|nr:hypothetical protein [Candidatus Babeliales bacterium]